MRAKPKSRLKYRWRKHCVWLLVLGVILIDALVKAMMTDWLLNPPQMLAITPFFNLTPVWNQGVSFGFLQATSPLQKWLLISLTGLIGAGLALWIRRSIILRERLILGLILGGALGNIIDRIRFGAVFDFFDFHLAGHHWPAFNVADACIVVGVGLLIMGFGKHKIDDEL
jgi:signal peptidase II